MNQELVSVIIPTYNLEAYIEGCIASVRNQDYENLEILVVDDGSRDGTPDILRRLSREDSRIRLFGLTHRGVCAVRNFGLEQAKGQYLAFLDGDDAWRPDFVSTMVRALEDVDMAVCGMETPDSPSLRDEMAKNPTPAGAEACYSADAYIRGMLREELSERIGDKFFRRCHLAEQRFPEDLSHNEDKYFLYRLLRALDWVRVLDRKPAIYLQRGDSLSHAAYAPDNYLAARRMLEECSGDDPAHLEELRRHYRLMLVLNLRMLVRSGLPRAEKRREFARLTRELAQAPKCAPGRKLGVETAVLRLGFPAYTAFVHIADIILDNSTKA